jgi:hypothetical protein
LVDAPDSKSGGARAPCRFEPDLRYLSARSSLQLPLVSISALQLFSFLLIAEIGYIIPVLAVEESVVRCEIRTAAAKLFAGVDAWSGDVYNPLTIIELKPVALACHAWVK